MKWKLLIYCITVDILLPLFFVRTPLLLVVHSRTLQHSISNLCCPKKSYLEKNLEVKTSIYDVQNINIAANNYLLCKNIVE